MGRVITARVVFFFLLSSFPLLFCLFCEINRVFVFAFVRASSLMTFAALAVGLVFC